MRVIRVCRPTGWPAAKPNVYGMPPQISPGRGGKNRKCVREQNTPYNPPALKINWGPPPVFSQDLV